LLLFLAIFVGVVYIGKTIFLIAQGITSESHILIDELSVRRFCSLIFDSQISYFLAIEDIVSPDTTL